MTAVAAATETIAVADIGGLWRLDRVTDALTTLAEATLSLAVAHLLRAAHDAGELRLPDPAQPARGGAFTVIEEYLEVAHRVPTSLIRYLLPRLTSSSSAD